MQSYMHMRCQARQVLDSSIHTEQLDIARLLDTTRQNSTPRLMQSALTGSTATRQELDRLDRQGLDRQRLDSSTAPSSTAARGLKSKTAVVAGSDVDDSMFDLPPRCRGPRTHVSGVR